MAHILTARFFIIPSKFFSRRQMNASAGLAIAVEPTATREQFFLCADARTWNGARPFAAEIDRSDNARVALRLRSG